MSRKRKKQQNIRLLWVLAAMCSMAIYFYINDPKDLFTKKDTLDAAAIEQANQPSESQDLAQATTTISLDQLVAFERLQQENVRLGFERGDCSVAGYKEILDEINGSGRKPYFFPLPYKGKKEYNEYVNLLYIDHFEKVICQKGEFFRARLGLNQAECTYMKWWVQCGSDYLTKHTYTKMKTALEQLNPGIDYNPKRTINSDTCECP